MHNSPLQRFEMHLDDLQPPVPSLKTTMRLHLVGERMGAQTVVVLGGALKRRMYRFLYNLLYNQLAHLYDLVSWSVSLGQWDRWRRTALGYVHGKRVLEVGFGTGALLPLLAVKVPMAVGIEASASMQRLAARRIHTQSFIYIPRVQGVAQRLPFADESFDTIVSTFPAGFILDPAAHQEFARVLQTNGRLIVVDVQLVSSHPLLRMLYHLVFPEVKGAEEQYQQASAAARLTTWTERVGGGLVHVAITISEKTNLDHLNL